MLRGVAAVIVGYLAMAICVAAVTGVTGWLFPAWSSPQNSVYVIFNLAYSFVFALAGGYVAGVVARRQQVRHTVALAILVLILAVISVWLQSGREPLWYQIGLIVLMPPGIVWGGYLQARRPSAA